MRSETEDAMATITNPGASADGTDGDDLFIVTDGGVGVELLDGKDGIDTLQMDYSVHNTLGFVANGVASAGALGGSFTRIDSFIRGEFVAMEILDIVGSPNADRFTLLLDETTIESSISLDAGGGIDELTLNLTDVTRNLVIDASGGPIVMPFGTLANFENFTFYGGAGDDTIIGGNEGNGIRGGGGSNVMIGGSGRDFIRSTSITDYSDGGAGTEDTWQGIFEGLSDDLSIEIGEQISVNGNLAAENFESALVTGGSGSNEIEVTGLSQLVHIHEGAGTDSLKIDLATVDVALRSTLILDDTGSRMTGHVGVGFSYTDQRVHFDGLENLDLALGTADDSLGLHIRAFDPSIGTVLVDGGGGTDHLVVYVSRPASFTTGPGRSATTGFVTLTNFETYDVTGSYGADHFRTSNSDDRLIGDRGNDWMAAGGGADFLDGGAGDDTLFGQGAADEIHGGDGNDYISGGLGNDNIDSGEGDDQIFAGGGHDVVTALGGNDTIFGGAGNDTLNAGQGNDLVNGQAGDDVIFSALGTDLIVGGPGADRFVFNGFYLSSQPSLTDRIKDFTQADGDLIDLHYADADTTVAGNQAFNWIGNAAFSGTAGELRAEIAGNTTTIYADTNGNGTANFVLLLTGQVELQTGDFVL
jgi:Ca2+-binding RTX toxin-like protein